MVPKQWYRKTNVNISESAAAISDSGLARIVDGTIGKTDDIELGSMDFDGLMAFIGADEAVMA